jgi:hypothetical protein
MRAARVLFLVAIGSAAVTALASGCHTATQVTLDISTTAACSDLKGTALVVGTSPTDTENKSYPLPGTTSASYNIVTNECTGSKIGTLVVTPADGSMEAAVVVVAAYSSPTIPVHDPSSCVAPDFKNCIVARRRFTFIEHAKLTIPIVLDPDCVNVPCNAVSTCHKGKCVDSTVETSDDGTPVAPPGELADGGTDPDAIVVAPPDPPNPFPPGAPPPNPPPPNPPPTNPPPPTPPPTGGDAGDAVAPPTDSGTFCETDAGIYCNGAPCGSGTVCCFGGAMPDTCTLPGACASAVRCCSGSTNQCTATSYCPTSAPGVAACQAGTSGPTCNAGALQCPSSAGQPNGPCSGTTKSCCDTTGTCGAQLACTNGERYCCQNSDCFTQSTDGGAPTCVMGPAVAIMVQGLNPQPIGMIGHCAP